MTEAQVKNAVEKFEALIRAQSDRSDKIKAQGDFIDFKSLDKIIIGVCGGDGIGPVITKESARVLEYLLDDKVKAGKIEFKVIDGLTIENRVKANKAIPDDVLEELKSCHVILKGPTTTPQAGDPWPNIESANVAMRKALDLFANLRPVKVPEQGIDWTFFRENTEGAYAVGSMGVNVTDDLALDFVVTTTEGCDRIARLAYDYARRNNKGRVSIITKANVIKTTDGKFLNLCKKVGEEYPDIVTDEWYIDITTAKLIDEKRRRDFKVFILPNLYGDIITDEAAEFQGGVYEDVQTTWLSSAVYYPTLGRVRFRISEELKPYIIGISKRKEPYTEFETRELISTTYYTSRIYELACQYLKCGKRPKMSIDELRSMLGIPADKYKLFAHFKDRVLDTAVQAIRSSKELRYEVGYELFKSGRSSSSTAASAH